MKPSSNSRGQWLYQRAYASRWDVRNCRPRENKFGLLHTKSWMAGVVGVKFATETLPNSQNEQRLAVVGGNVFYVSTSPVRRRRAAKTPQNSDGVTSSTYLLFAAEAKTGQEVFKVAVPGKFWEHVSLDRGMIYVMMETSDLCDAKVAGSTPGWCRASSDCCGDVVVCNNCYVHAALLPGTCPRAPSFLV